MVTCDFPDTPAHEVIDGVEVYRIDSYKNPSPDFAILGLLNEHEHAKRNSCHSKKNRRTKSMFSTPMIGLWQMQVSDLNIFLENPFW